MSVRIALSIAVASFAIAGTAAAQGSISWLDRIHLRQSVDAQDVSQKPAQLSITIPDSGRTTYMLAAALSYDLMSGSHGFVSAYAEIAKNSAISKPQDVLTGGLSYEWQPFAVTAGGHHMSPVFQGSGDAKHDAINGTESAQLSFGSTLVAGGSGWVPSRFIESDGLRWGYVPFVGLEYEGEWYSRTSKSSSGSTARAVGRLDLTLQPWYRLLDKKLELSFAFADRRDVLNTEHQILAWRPYGTVAVTYYLLKSGTHTVGLTMSGTNGQDPTQGLKEQKFAQLAVLVGW
jgi:hypothetical protein